MDYAIEMHTQKFSIWQVVAVELVWPLSTQARSDENVVNCWRVTRDTYQKKVLPHTRRPRTEQAEVDSAQGICFPGQHRLGLVVRSPRTQ